MIIFYMEMHTTHTNIRAPSLVFEILEYQSKTVISTKRETSDLWEDLQHMEKKIAAIGVLLLNLKKKANQVTKTVIHDT